MTRIVAPLADDIAARLPPGRAQAKKLAVKPLAAGAFEIGLYGEIGFDVTAAGVRDALKGIGPKAKLTVRLNSGGGSVFEGFAIYNMLARHEGEITVVVEALAASMASLIAMVGDVIEMPTNSFMMIHNPWAMAMGDAEAMRDMADLLDKLRAPMRATYAARSGLKETTVEAMMAAETWLTADEAVEAGFATATLPAREIAARADLSRFATVPAALAAAVASPACASHDDDVPVPATVPASAEASVAAAIKEGPMPDPTPAAAAAASVPPAATPAPTPTPSPVAASLAEVQAVAARARLDDSWVVAQLAAAATLDQVRDAAIDARATPATDAARVTMVADHTDPAGIIDAMGTALAGQVFPQLRTPQGRWREYAALKPSHMLLELAQARGQRVGVRDIAKLVQGAAMHSTGDFPLLLENAQNKMLEAGYQAASPTYRAFFGRRRFNDFRSHKFYTAGDFPALEVLLEGANINLGTISEKREQVTLKTHAKGISVTRQMLVNDDLSAFNDFGGMIGRRIADYENAVAYAVVNTASGDGPTLETGAAAVFSTAAGRANKASASTVIDDANVDLGFAAISNQTSIDGIKLNLQPRILLVGTARRGQALRLVANITPNTTANVALYGGLQVVVDANIPGNRWYMFAEPASSPVYVYGYLGDAEGPMVRIGQPMGTDGTVIEVVHDFGVGAIDHRGGYFNAGN